MKKAARARGEELKREKRKLCTDKPMRVFPPVLKRTACLIVSTKEQRRIYRIFFEEGLSSAVEVSSTYLWRFFLSALCNKCDVNAVTLNAGLLLLNVSKRYEYHLNNDTCER